MADQQGDFIAGVVTGAVLGGILGGVIGFVLAPKIGKGSAEGQRRDPERLNGSSTIPMTTGRPRIGASSTSAIPNDWNAWETEAERIAQARRTLEAKIAELNEAIQATRAQLLVKDVPSASQEKRGE
ncbi:hypothetical protein [Thermostichus vulcanus]|uniref:Gas vesicle protein n=1 Tax=Thermostichus vulcanus str. 'Rupite' TaxID=2813851 RepID=A0ABT0CA57_THEVL|nr:hypothetical protein [Thermostichus vulcanus]MCJ2542663.1 hypothetical protein [Thermostichus vulcanus str. 'Rupite']